MQLLKTLEKHPKKSLSQNFLIDKNILDKIIRTADIKTDDRVLEIGPGAGALTIALLKAKPRVQVIAVEKDRVFASYLKNLHLPNLTVAEDDILKTDLVKLVKKFPNANAGNLTAARKVKVVSNLPYNIATAVIIKLLQQHRLFSSLTLMMQKEVAERIVAGTKTKAYGSLSLFVKTYAEAEIAFIVSPASFYPRPEVKSAVVNFKLKKPPLKKTELEQWHGFVRTAFAQRRKKLTSSLKKTASKETVSRALTDLNLSLDSRPEELAFQEFLNLFHKIFLQPEKTLKCKGIKNQS